MGLCQEVMKNIPCREKSGEPRSAEFSDLRETLGWVGGAVTSLGKLPRRSVIHRTKHLDHALACAGKPPGRGLDGFLRVSFHLGKKPVC